MFRKIIAAVLLAGALVTASPTPASAIPAAGGGVYVGEKQLCKTPTNWFERHILQQASYKWVRCNTL